MLFRVATKFYSFLRQKLARALHWNSIKGINDNFVAFCFKWVNSDKLIFVDHSVCQLVEIENLWSVDHHTVLIAFDLFYGIDRHRRRFQISWPLNNIKVVPVLTHEVFRFYQQPARGNRTNKDQFALRIDNTCVLFSCRQEKARKPSEVVRVERRSKHYYDFVELKFLVVGYPLETIWTAEEVVPIVLVAHLIKDSSLQIAIVCCKRFQQILHSGSYEI